jgi:hypothetical protein
MEVGRGGAGRCRPTGAVGLTGFSGTGFGGLPGSAGLRWRMARAG